MILELKAAPNAGSWSINEPDQITLTRPVKNPSVGSATFASGAILSPKAIEIIQRESFQRLLKELGMGAGESLNFYNNAVVYYARSGDASKFLERTNAICHFMAGLTGSEKTELRKVDLPEPFAALNDCAQEWAISDDIEREDAIKRASPEKLRTLLDKVDPMMPEINAYLGAHSGEKEAVLASLAETASEAKLVLEQVSSAHHDRKQAP